jgi:RNA polymerase sigma-70 factor (ECF subfamily)
MNREAAVQSDSTIVADESRSLDAARAGDHRAFRALAARHERELLVHCYRMLGSIEDAEDMVQETFLRAWRSLNTFEGRSMLRAWLYRIATNVSLDALAKRRRRSLPTLTHAPGNPQDPYPPPPPESPWLEPLPDALVDERPGLSPETRYEVRESVTLAFLTALQCLPGRQRAVLLLCDVLGWSARETAEILEMSGASVTSSLQRARGAMKKLGAQPGSARKMPTDEVRASLLTRYVRAWEAADTESLVALLQEDAAMTMPPIPLWLRGKNAIAQFLASRLFSPDARGTFRLAATSANGCPAFAVYRRDEAGRFRPASLHVLVLDTDLIAEMHSFLVTDDRLFDRFGVSPGEGAPIH